MKSTIEVLEEAKEAVNEAVHRIKDQTDFTSDNFVKIVLKFYEDIESEVRVTMHKHGRQTPPPRPRH
jgi:hypothetical protein